ncbi:hypothetical protein FRC0313_00777 [Corynebacterium diphtheriae]|nr:hypothetical protein FRC0313_00777 [Corynebacterium diphtheriae]CAB0898336.1 hypothetical protein FRC0417_00777 [Corynebacterium diphtheriae]
MYTAFVTDVFSLEDHRVGVVGFDAHFKPCYCKH